VNRNHDRSSRTACLIAALCLHSACSAPAVKPDAFDPELLERRPLPADFLVPAPRGERQVVRDPAWLAIDAGAAPTFAALREADGTEAFVYVVDCAALEDRLVVLPLATGETPLEVLGSSERLTELAGARERYLAGDAAGMRTLSMLEAMTERRLASPLPPPKHVFAVAANYPSHLRSDLARPEVAERAEEFGKTRARVFLKHPPTRPAVVANTGRTYSGLAGPYDGIQCPEEILLPPEEGEEPKAVTLRLDYEVEVGVVFGRTLTPEDARAASDAEIRAAVAGYVLVSDAKARNPQVLDNLQQALREPAADAAPYRPEADDLAGLVGVWGAVTADWWSYAASFGDFTALGPFFVAAPADGSFPARGMLSARTYATEEIRGESLPFGREPDVPYLRQCSITAEGREHADGLIWPVPDIVRSILSDDGVLPFPDGHVRIEAGDVISLGTPGGTIITVKPSASILRRILFWWAPRDFHDAFFATDDGLYLLGGDVVFYWVEGLGCQRHEVVLDPAPGISEP